MELEQIKAKWEDILVTLKTEYSITEISFNSWLKPLVPFSLENDTLMIVFHPQNDEDAEPDQMAINYITRKYSKFLSIVISETFGLEEEIKLKFVSPMEAFDKADEVTREPEQNSLNYATSHLNAKYTFDTFVVGGNNKFARQASLAVAESPGEAYNPLYIYGGPGLGKTHLLHSIGNFILNASPDKKVLYVTSEQFLNEVIEGIRNSSNSNIMTKTREKYRSVDVLLIDDIQILIGKESTQQEFFNTFNTLYLAGKQIVITSDKPPKEMETLEERIRSRFESGLMADIGNPDYETRMAILRKKVESEKINFSDDVLDYIAENIQSNIRELEGALNKLIACSNLEKKEITLDIAMQELQNIISPDKPREVTPQLIIEVVSEHYNVSMEKMLSKDRSKSVSKPRQIAMYLCKTMTSSTLDGIGQLLNGRDHSTIIHGYNVIEEEYNTDEEFRKQIDTIKKKINPN
jgi:chromosomal replication initiator protein